MLTLTSLKDPQLIATLQAGKLAVIPTDTLYGVVALAANQTAVQAMYALKQREGEPDTVIAASVEQLVELGLKARYLQPVQHYWPGPVSVVIPTGFALTYLAPGVGTIAVRITNDKAVNTLLERVGPLLTSSANLPGEPPATTIAEAINYFKDTVDCYVDGGDLSDRQPSTILRIVDDAVEVLREGAIKIDEAGRVIP